MFFSLSESKPREAGFELTPAQGKALETITSDAAHNALGGGSRCVAGDTVLDGHTETIAELAAKGDPVDVITTHGKQTVDAPFKKGRATLLRVTTDTGRAVEVTPDHRFWNGAEWIKARDLTVGSPLACLSSEQSLPASSSGTSLSRSLSSVQRWTQTLASLTGRCFGRPRRYGQQLHLSSTDAQACRALLSGEQVRNLLGLSPACHASLLRESGIRTDQPLTLSEVGSLIDPRCDRPPMTGDSPSTCSAALSANRASSQTYARFQRSRLARLLSGSLSFVKRSWQVTARNDAHQLSRFSYHAYSDTPINNYQLEKVSRITETPVKDYYTLHVPSTEQYFANGLLHHNSGKTFLLVMCVVARALKARDSRHAVFRFRLNALISSVVRDTLPKVIKLCWPGLWDQCKYNGTENFLSLPNGSEIWFAGLDDKDRTEKILGMEFATTYFNECSQIPYASVVLALTRLAQKTPNLSLKAYYDFNPPSKIHWTYLTFVKKINPETKRPHKNEFNYSFYLINPADNKEHLDKAYLEMLDALPEKARNRFLLGKFADDSDGALWTEELLAQNRILDGNIPDFLRVVVAVDPSGCRGPDDTRSDEVGIAVTALGTDGKGYLLEDLSGRYSPEEWSKVCNDAFHRHKADAVIGERNYGGDMVRAVLQAQNPDLPFKEVTASRGKVVRAEPIASLYTQKKVHHVGYFDEIEDQMCAMTLAGYQGMKSPDRADACLIASTLVTTLRGDVPIHTVTTDDYVLTRQGWFPVEWSGMTKLAERTYDVNLSDGTTVTATSEHPFYTSNRGFIPVDTLVCGDIMHHIDESRGTLWQQLKLHLTGKLIDGIQKAKTRASSAITFAHQARGSRPCTVQCGSIPTAQSLKDITYTISTVISSTMTYLTSNVLTQKNMVNDMPQVSVQTKRGDISHESDLSQQSGTAPLKGSSGTSRTVETHGSDENHSSPEHANSVTLSSRLSMLMRSSVVSRVMRKTGTTTTGTMSKSLVQSVRSIFGRINTSRHRKHAPVTVVQITERDVKPVYNIHVDGPHEFFANGILVHNCIWGLTELFPSMTESREAKNWTPPPVKAYTRTASRFDRM